MDEDLAVQQAAELHKAGIAKRFGTDEKTFIRILTQASHPQIQVPTPCSAAHTPWGGIRPIDADVDRVLLLRVLPPSASAVRSRTTVIMTRLRRVWHPRSVDPGR